MRLGRLWFLLALVLAASRAGAATMPLLDYTPPANAYAASAGPGADFFFNGFNASVEVYPFRPTSSSCLRPRCCATGSTRSTRKRTSAPHRASPCSPSPAPTW